MLNRKTLPFGTMAVILVISLALIGVGYGLWSQVLTIQGQVNTGSLAAAFTQSFSDDDGSVDDNNLDANDDGECAIQAGGETSCDPAASGPDPKDRHEKDVASCVTSISSDGTVGRVTKNGAYPGYFCTAWFQVENQGSVPVRIASARINGQDVTPSVPTALDLNDDNEPDVRVHLTGFDICQQVDPNNGVLVDVDQEILQGIPQGSTLSYEVELQLNQWNEECTPPSLPAFTVTQSGLTTSQADALASSLGVADTILQDDGTARFTSENFLAIPMVDLGEQTMGEEEEPAVLEAFNFDELNQREVVSQEEAIQQVMAALKQAELAPGTWGPINAQPTAGHSMLNAVNVEGESMVGDGIPLDTHVNLGLTLGGIPFEGPGAKIKVVLDEQGEVANLLYAMRGLEAGPQLQIMPPSKAQETCAANLRGQLDQPAQEVELNVSTRLLYHAPALELGSVQTIYPFYECGGSFTIGDEQFQLRTTLLPAVAEAVGPNVEMSASIDERTVTAGAEVSGGTPPYTFKWSSSTTPVDLPDEPQVQYDVAPPTEDVKTGDEVLALLVEDANGLTASASATLTFSDTLIFDPPVGLGALASPLQVGGVTDVGAEWYGKSCPSAALPKADANALGFTGRMAISGANVRFTWGNQNSWERDFIDPGQRANGLDDDYVDNVDFTFYTGHANGNSWSFCSNQQDGRLHYTENPRFGNNHDLEWLVVAACGPLQLNTGAGPWWQRWGPAFDGMHLFMGYQTVTADNDREGRLLAGYALSGRTIRESWVQTAIDVQRSDDRWAVMGPIGPGGWVNYNDHFWGQGSVGPDIRGSDLQGWWIIWGPA